jgi:oligo-1,6-glucosidase
MTVGETPFTNDPNQLAPYVLPISKELNMVFQFQLMHIDSPHSDGSDTEPYKNDPLVWMDWELNEMKTIVETWQTFKRDEGYWNAYVWIRDFVWYIQMTKCIVHSIFIENHDQPRSVSRFGNDSAEWRTISAQLLAIFQITQTGTLYVYQGEEIGMKNFPRSWPIEEYKDVATINYWNL